jgi:hypothetical protein
MSYDLYFYKKKQATLTEAQIKQYLTVNLDSTSENKKQWFAENEDTETYFFIEQNEPETDEEAIEVFESFEDFENTRFSFNLNFIRPDFFGQNAFKFVDKIIKGLDLFVLNPQSSTDADNPFKPNPEELYNNWSSLNARHCVDLFKECALVYYPLDKSNEFYEYNAAKEKLQNQLGGNYYVPKLYLFKRKADDKIITISTWTEHITNVFPPADIEGFLRQWKKLDL